MAQKSKAYRAAAEKIEDGKYYTPSGVEIQANGIKPTVESLQSNEETFNPDDETEVVQPTKPVANDDDKQLKKAIEILRDPSKAALKPAA